MSFAAEMRDFLGAFSTVAKVGADSAYNNARAEYYNNAGGATGDAKYMKDVGKAASSNSILGRLLGDNKVDDNAGLSSFDQGAKNIASGRDRALAAGDIDAVARFDKKAAELLKMRPGTSAPKKLNTAIPTNTDSNYFFGAPAGTFTPDNSPLDVDVDDVEEEDDPENGNPNLGTPPAITGIYANGGLVGDNSGAIPTVYAGGAGPIYDTQRVFAVTGGLMSDDEDNTDEPLEQAIPAEPAALADPAPAPAAAPVAQEAPANTDADDVLAAKMDEIAGPGVVAGLDKIQKEVTSSAAIPQADPAAATGVRALANNVGAATHEEVIALDKMIDPENKMPARAKSAARIAAIWDTMGDKNPDKAAALAQGLLLYDKQNSQTRGALAEEALKNNNPESAIKLIADAHNNDLPGNQIMTAAYNPDDNTTSVKITENGNVKLEGKATIQQVAQMASEVKSGSAYIDALAPLAAQHKRRAGEAEAKSREGKVSPDIFLELQTAKRNVAKAIADNKNNTPDEIANIEQYKALLDGYEEKARKWAMGQKDPINMMKQLGITETPSAIDGGKGGKAEPVGIPTKISTDILVAKRRLARAVNDNKSDTRPELDAIKEKQAALDAAEETAMKWAMGQKNSDKLLADLGIGAVPSSIQPSNKKSVGDKTGAKSPASVPNQTAAERGQEALDTELNDRLYKAYSLEKAGIPVDTSGKVDQTAIPTGMSSESARVEAARRSIDPIRQSVIADYGYNKTPDVSEYTKKPFNERVSDLNEALDGYLTDTSPSKTPVPMDAATRREMLRTADRIASKNSVDPRQIIEFLMKVPTDLTTPMQTDPKTGEITFGGNKLFVDRDTLGMLAKQRGENMKASRIESIKKADETKKQQLAAAVEMRNKRGEAKDAKALDLVTQVIVDIPDERLPDKLKIPGNTKERYESYLEIIEAEFSYLRRNPNDRRHGNAVQMNELNEARDFLKSKLAGMEIKPVPRSR